MKTSQALSFFLLIILSLSACSDNDSSDGSFSFYHWKAQAKSTDKVKSTLSKHSPKSIYLRYFDVDVVNKTEYGNEIYPVAVLTEVDDDFKDYQIVPVVFITNRVFTGDVYVSSLAYKIKNLVQEISKDHFPDREITEIQLDCDWTQTTKAKYFELINTLKKDFVVGCTIRLHQIKYQNETGIPEVNRGTLMLYNVGDLANMEKNSILDKKIVADYINNSTTYPIELKVALPLFDQTVVKNTDGNIRLITGVNRESLQQDQTHFEQVNEQLFRVKSDVLYRGLYLFKDYTIKLEETEEDAVINAYETVKSSDLNTTDIIFYHLDDATLNSIDFEKISKAL